MYRDYRDKGVNFYYVYSNIQHPETNGFVEPYTIKERLMHIKEAKRRTGSEIPWLCDTMKNEIKASLQAAPNAEFVIDPDGKIVRKRFWSDPITLREDLAELIGAVDSPTKVADLPTRFKVESREVAANVVPRINLPRGLEPIHVEAIQGDDATPFFAKLRAEATRSLIRHGKGKMYLGFYVDPIYQVHWNNRMGEFKVSIKDADGVTFSEQELVGPNVEPDADIDPRQFLIDVEMEDKDQPIKMSVSYAVCDDAETFCVPVKQNYTLSIERDKYGGTRPGIFLIGMFAEVEKMDKNKDGTLTADELPDGRKTLYIGHMDKNENGQIDPEEISEFKAMFGNGAGFGTTINDGDR